MFWNLNKVIVTENDALPVDWKAMSPSGRVFVEIGFGNGEFLEFLAKNDPDVLVVGVEVSQWCAAKGARRILAAGLENARVMHGDARFLLRHCFAPESVEHVYMNFPCPWPKTRHAARRVTVPAFAGLMNYLIKPGGSFELATDVDWYAEETAEVFAAVPSFRADPVEINPVRPYVTKYERKWKAMGKDTWRLLVHKDAELSEKPGGEEDWPMECECVSKKSVKDILDSLKGSEGAGVGGCGHWVFRDGYISEEGVGLLLVITADEGFEQHFYLKVIPNVRGGITIKVDSVGHPYRTPAMRAALLKALAAAGA
ncbi:MAG: tRNA (guanosine(46)-N7)-methyltransferase TrmB [Synergistes sp.]|nr:tRNA (guanosine(46)-N7)-methyltransferase TrmB [Synergistes sp.]